MHLFAYEFITGGGTWTSDTLTPDGPLLAEGAAMARAILADVVAIPGLRLSSMLDARLQGLVHLPGTPAVVADAAQERETFERLVRQADATLIIAPEIGGALLDRCRRVESLGGRLVSPDSQFVAIASDKQQTAERLNDRGVTVPRGMRLQGDACEVPEDQFPAVVKPCDGAGSWHVTRIADRDQLRRQIASPALQQEFRRGNLRLERFVPGLAASVAVLCGPQQRAALEPCEQILAEGEFEYLGGRLPLAMPLAMRARKLALAAIDVMPHTIGYVGVDLVLGVPAAGSEDYIIEINPRLTTSYVGLRSACRQNLAAAMLDIAAGRPATVSFAREPLEFRSDGTILPAVSGTA